jgi:hypothetical protein
MTLKSDLKATRRGQIEAMLLRDQTLENLRGATEAITAEFKLLPGAQSQPELFPPWIVSQAPRHRSVLSTSGFGPPLRRSAKKTASSVGGTNRRPDASALAPARSFVLAGFGQSVQFRGKNRSLALVLHP